MEEVYIIYGITDCPACLRAQADLMDLGKEYVFIQTDFSKYYRATVKEEFNWKTFPIILLISPNGEKLIGGYDQLWFHLESEGVERDDFCDEPKHCSIFKTD